MSIPLVDWLTTASASFGLVALAELGDKTQLVCMVLASQYQALPVLLGAVLAFALLNLLAVLFGAAVAAWLPEAAVAAAVAVLFAAFGVLALRGGAADEEEDMATRGGQGILLSTFLLIFLAELGDKTQLAVVGLASTAASVPVWSGATLGLAFTSGLAVVAGRTLLQRISLRLVRQISGGLFLLLAAVALWRVVTLLRG